MGRPPKQHIGPANEYHDYIGRLLVRAIGQRDRADIDIKRLERALEINKPKADAEFAEHNRQLQLPTNERTDP